MHYQKNVYLLVMAMILCCGICSKEDITLCITNCGQCKQMFGSYFRGPVCAESCIASNGRLLPDCNNPHTLIGFIKRAYLHKTSKAKLILHSRFKQNAA